MPIVLRWFLSLLGCLTIWATQPLRAHDAGLSVTEIRLRADGIELSATYAVPDVRAMLPPSVQLGTDSSAPALDGARAALDELASLLWDVGVDGQPLSARESRIEFNPSDNLAFIYVYPRPPSGQVVFRAANLGGLPSSHREVITLFDEAGRVRAQRILSAAASTLDFSLEEIAADPATPVARADLQHAPRHGTSASLDGPASAPMFRAFFKLGVEHIWTGYDHLLFLFALLLVCRSFRSIVVIISCFTVAHSITLGLAALEVVSLPGELIEPLIAASIIYVGVENLWRRGVEPRGRAWLTFAFGLIHGFGFAGVLRDLGVGAEGGGIVLPLVSFNLGVEAGQVVVAAIVLPVLMRVFRNEKTRHRVVPVASVLVAAAGLYWLLERTLLS